MRCYRQVITTELSRTVQVLENAGCVEEIAVRNVEETLLSPMPECDVIGTSLVGRHDAVPAAFRGVAGDRPVTTWSATVRGNLHPVYREMIAAVEQVDDQRFMQLTKNRVPLRSSLFAGCPVLLVAGGSATKVGGGTVPLKEGATGYVVDPGDARTPRLPTIRTMFAGAPIVVTAKRQGEAHWENMELCKTPIMIYQVNWQQIAAQPIHGSQGLEFPAGWVPLDVVNNFDWHMALVAISRFCDLEFVRASTPIDWNIFRMHPKLKAIRARIGGFNITSAAALYARVFS